jgi:hypothetical protein
MSTRASVSVAAVALAACTQASPADCPPSSRLESGHCAPFCSGPTDCLASEVCASGVCVLASIGAEGPRDAGAPNGDGAASGAADALPTDALPTGPADASVDASQAPDASFDDAGADAASSASDGAVADAGPTGPVLCTSCQTDSDCANQDRCLEGVCQEQACLADNQCGVGWTCQQLLPLLGLCTVDEAACTIDATTGGCWRHSSADVCAAPGPVDLCGERSDGCGGTVQCACRSPESCGGAGQPDECGVPACLPSGSSCVHDKDCCNADPSFPGSGCTSGICCDAAIGSFNTVDDCNRARCDCAGWSCRMQSDGSWACVGG